MFDVRFLEPIDMEHRRIETDKVTTFDQDLTPAYSILPTAYSLLSFVNRIADKIALRNNFLYVAAMNLQALGFDDWFQQQAAADTIGLQFARVIAV